MSVASGSQRVVIDDETIGEIEMSAPTYRGDFYVHNAGCIARYGIVVDKATQRPVFGARISNPYGSASTDSNGWFRVNLGCSGDTCAGFNTTFLYITHPNYADGQIMAGRGICFVSRMDIALEHR